MTFGFCISDIAKRHLLARGSLRVSWVADVDVVFVKTHAILPRGLRSSGRGVFGQVKVGFCISSRMRLLLPVNDGFACLLLVVTPSKMSFLAWVATCLRMLGRRKVREVPLRRVFRSFLLRFDVQRLFGEFEVVVFHWVGFACYLLRRGGVIGINRRRVKQTVF